MAMAPARLVKCSTTDSLSDETMSPSAFELIERWENVERVLVDLPEHKRTKHFDMAEFATSTPCGTVCCAAGFCAFDPWFNERGWKAIPFDAVYWQVPYGIDIHRFFGLEGSVSIFHDYTTRPVETVIEEVREHIKKLRRQAFGLQFATFRARVLGAMYG